ncbi:MAG: EpsG family protein [Clostridiales bacterium]|nr:EpsG family protein [Clostridiales bacterium]
MNIYFWNVVLTLFWGLLLRISGNTENGKRAFCTITALQWILISGLRGMTVSKDMYTYKIKFYDAMNMEWKSVFDKFYLVYVEGNEGKDPGYDVFTKIVQLFTDDYQVFLFVCASIFFIGMAVWIFKYSEYPLLSMILFDSFLYSFFALTGIRQTLATVLVVFIGSKYIRDREFKKFIILAIVAYTLHKSSLTVLVFYFISRIPITRKYIVGLLALFPVLFVLREPYFNIIGTIVGYEYDEFENTGAYMFTFLYLMVVFVSLIFLPWIKQNCYNYQMYFNAMFMGMVLIPLVFVNPAAMRAVQYFSLYLMLYIPQLVKTFEVKLRGPMYTLLVAVLLLATNAFARTDYTFFWQ